MTSLFGLNLIFHSIQPKGGMERHVLDLISYASEQGLPVRAVTRHLNWPAPLPRHVEFVVVPDRTPFARLNTLIFESSALAKCRPEWPTIGISRVPGVEMSIVGGTHKAHLLDRKRGYTGLLDLRTIARERTMYQQAQVIVAHSAKVANEISHHYGIDPHKVSTFYPPVDTAAFSLCARNQRDAMRKKWA
ncbi:glycosyltransferase family 4 protein [Rhodoferax sp.]|uniref:glycosyltransferase family 4 protein n=1 Tax=Rhodoferax sp. TaxID=50421 RepID=UPI002ACE3B97|nr:glycosyltransferase family 4 protein [Rhodoferax sp.]MDZ7921049.1 glycosyltransferase family 4 protein [Rhodoferax sp.]